MFDPERRIDVEWEKGTEEARYVVRLTMQVEDRRGILADVSAKVADINTNITSVEATTDEDQRGRIDMTVRDQRPEAPREGDEVAEVGRRRDRRGAGHCALRSPRISLLQAKARDTLR